MIRSMTGYGNAQGVKNGLNIVVEIKSVNHRYFEFSSRVPRTYGFLDEKLKGFLQEKISRGKVECYVQIEAAEEAEVVVNINHALLSGYINAFNEMSARYGIENDVTIASVSRLNDIFTIRKDIADEDTISAAVLAVAGEAVEKFLDMRQTEGERLKKDIIARVATIEERISFIESRSPQTVYEYNEKLKTRMKDLLGDVHVDEQRLIAEAAVFADKIAVAEETVRLRSHLEQLIRFFSADEAVGRKMDFLVQEINREANTIGSKAQDMDITRCVVDIKSEIEKIREQVQNIE